MKDGVRRNIRRPLKRAIASPRRMSLKGSFPRAARGNARAIVTSPGHRSLASGAGERSLLLVLDESPEAKRAVAYVGSVLGRRRGFRVCIAYILPELPPRFLENGGAGDPGAEDRLAASLHAERRQWIAQHKREARRVIDEAIKSLRTAGLTSNALDVRFCGPVTHSAVADELLRLARARRCRTVVLGRHRRSWLSHLFAEDLREELARRAEGIAIWGIG